MKTPVSNLEVTSTITGVKDIEMSIHAGSMGHVMNVLAGLYSDSVLAIIREYSTNARDSHVEAGKEDVPIEVTLPTMLSPIFKVKDYGVGLSENDIINIYSKYGASTKRDTNKQTGLLGFGCKSALAYANQFTLVGVKNGMKCSVAVSRSATGSGKMTIISNTPTSEENGVEVAIPAHNHSKFLDKAPQFFKYWPEGSVLIDGKEPALFRNQTNLLWVNNNLALKERTYSYAPASHKIVMGNVAYPFSLPEGLDIKNYDITAFVKMGAVTFPAPREALNEDEEPTISTIKGIVDAFKDKTLIQRQVNKCTSRQSAIATIIRWNDILPKPEDSGTRRFKFKGELIPEGYKSDCLVVGKHSNRLADHSNREIIPLKYFATSIWVTGYDRPQFNANHKKKLTKWFEGRTINDLPDEPRGFQRFLLFKGANIPNKYLDKRQIVDWSVIKKVVVNTRNDGRVSGSYNAYIGDTGWAQSLLAKDIDLDLPLYWTPQNDRDSFYYQNLSKHIDEFTLVVLPKNRRNKFFRDFPEAKEVKQGFVQAHKDWFKTLKTADKRALGLRDDGGESVKQLDPLKVKDPELRKAIRAANVDISEHVKKRSTFESFGIQTKIEPYRNPIRDYPLYDDSVLMRSYYGNGRDDIKTNFKHVYLYLNVAYETFK